MTQEITEQAVLIGAARSIVGIVTPAARLLETEDRLAVVMLNTGLIHRVGHNRMFVTMSRALAMAGFCTLRFDFSGVGDSDPRTDGLGPIDSCMADIGEALDWLTRHHAVSRVILLGLCSGADHAVLYSQNDLRVAAVVLMDPSIPATARHYFHYIAARLLRLRNWTNVIAGRSRLLQDWAGIAQGIAQNVLRPRKTPSDDFLLRSSLEQAYKAAIHQDIQILAIFSDESTRQTYREQMIDAYSNVRFGTSLRLEFLPDSDHIFSQETDRLRLTKLTLTFLASLLANSNPSGVSRAAPGQQQTVSQ